MTKTFSLWIFWKLFHYRVGFRFFSVPRSSVVRPSRISSAKGMTSGKIKSRTNTTAAKPSNFGKRSSDAYCISRSWIIRFVLLNMIYSNNAEGVLPFIYHILCNKRKNLQSGITLLEAFMSALLEPLIFSEGCMSHFWAVAEHKSSYQLIKIWTCEL